MSLNTESSSTVDLNTVYSQHDTIDGSPPSPPTPTVDFGLSENDVSETSSNSNSSNKPEGSESRGEGEGDEHMVCDPNTGQCLPSPPMRPSHSELRPRTASTKEAAIHSLSISATEVHNQSAGSSSFFRALFSPRSQKTKETIAAAPSENEIVYSIPLHFNQRKDYVEITQHDIEAAIGKSYVDLSRNHFESNALDVLALYIKGQKLLYTEAKTYCEQQLNFLMLPAIFISCVGSIFSFLSSGYVDGPLIIASLNGFNAFLLALISYLKLDAKAQAHKTSAYKFDKLESMCEFNSGRFMFFDTKVEDIVTVLNRMETNVQEIKETNQFILPESIRYEFAFTYSTNVFMLVKKTQSTEMAEIHNLKNCVNYIAKLRDQLTELNAGSPTSAAPSSKASMVKKLGEAIQLEERRKTQIVKTIMECRKRYFDLDEQFNKEIKKHIRRANKWFITRVFCCDWLKS